MMDHDPRYTAGLHAGVIDGINARSTHGDDEANPQDDDPEFVDGYLDGFREGQRQQLWAPHRELFDAVADAFHIPALLDWLDRGIGRVARLVRR